MHVYLGCKNVCVCVCILDICVHACISQLEELVGDCAFAMFAIPHNIASKDSRRTSKHSGNKSNFALIDVCVCVCRTVEQSP